MILGNSEKQGTKVETVRCSPVRFVRHYSTKSVRYDFKFTSAYSEVNKNHVYWFSEHFYWKFISYWGAMIGNLILVYFFDKHVEFSVNFSEYYACNSVPSTQLFIKSIAFISELSHQIMIYIDCKRYFDYESL